MNNTADRSAERTTLDRLSRDLAELRQRVEDLEDVRDLEKAIKENAGQPLLAWEEVKASLEQD